MPTVINLPALGESVSEGTVVRWLKAVGDTVAFEEPLLEVATDKVDTEIPSPVAGRIVEITVGEDQTVPVGAQLGLIAAEGDGSTEASPGPAPEALSAVAPEGDVKSAAAGGRPVGTFVTPLVRRLAAEHGIDLDTVEGTGMNGRVRKQDVLDVVARRQVDHRHRPDQASPTPGAVIAPASGRSPVVAAEAPEPPRLPAPVSPETPELALGEGRRERLTPRRKVIAARMVESLQTSAQLTSVVEVDVTSIYRQREAVKERFAAQHGAGLSYLPFFAKAALEGLREYPILNASIDMAAGEVIYHGHEHLAIAVDTPGGLLTPVIRNAGDLTVTGLARNIADLADRARTNRISPDELSGGTFTLTNTGSRGSLFDTPIINQPQAAILGTGAVVKRVTVIDDPELGETIAVRRMVYLALSYDHRLVDGADAARYLTWVAARLEGGSIQL